MKRVFKLYMPLAVTHTLIPLVLADIYRDHFAKKKFNLHYVFIVGLAGLLPDIDVVAFWIMKIFKEVNIIDVHRTFTHSLFFPLLFLVFFLVTSKVKIKFLNKNKLKLNYVFLAVAFGTFMHLALDGFLSGGLKPFYPVSDYLFDYALITMDKFGNMFFAGLDAILLVLWLIHEELNHKISDYI